MSARIEHPPLLRRLPACLRSWSPVWRATTRARTPTGSNSSPRRPASSTGRRLADRRQPARRLLDQGHRRRPRQRGSRGRRRLPARAGPRRRAVLGAAAPRRARRRRSADDRTPVGGLTVGAGHGHRLHYHGHSVVHRAPAHLKLVALVGVHARRGGHSARVVPRRSAATCCCCCGVVALSGVPAGYLAKRMLIETPFVLFAVAVPVHRRRSARRGARAVGLRARAVGRLGRCSPRARSACSPR